MDIRFDCFIPESLPSIYKQSVRVPGSIESGLTFTQELCGSEDISPERQLHLFSDKSGNKAYERK